METVMKADIFFVITTCAVVFLTIGVIIALRAFTRALNRIRAFVDKFEHGALETNETVKEMAEQVRESVLFNFVFAKKRKKRS